MSINNIGLLEISSKDKTPLTGVVLYSNDKNNQIQISSNTLTSTNLNDIDKSKTKGINANFSKSTDTVGLQYAKKDIEQLTQTSL